MCGSVINDKCSDNKNSAVSTLQIWLYTKGAESHVLPLCNLNQNTLISRTQTHINDYAQLGLRTLAVGRRKLSRSEYTDFYNGN